MDDSDSLKYRISIIKWISISFIIFISLFVTFYVIYTSLSPKITTKKMVLQERDSKKFIYMWYQDFPLIRGFTSDGKSFYVIKVNFAFKESNSQTADELYNKRFVIVDMLSVVLSSKTGEYLMNPANGDKIKYEFLDSVNSVLSYPVEDLGFTEYNIENI